MRGRASAAVVRFAPIAAAIVLCLLLAHCSNSSSVDARYGVSASPRVVAAGDPVPKGGGMYRIGAPYTVAGRVYVPEDNPHYRADGLASWYGDDFHGRLTANHEIFDLAGISAAHPTMPLPSYARVTNLSNGRSLIVRVNDRGPYHGNRIIDVSVRAAELLGFHARGTAWVRVEYVGPAPLQGSDDRLLAATLRQDEPAPAPERLMASARGRFFTVAQTVPPRGSARVASAFASDAAAASIVARAPARAAPLPGLDTTASVLSGRGLY